MIVLILATSVSLASVATSLWFARKSLQHSQSSSRAALSSLAHARTSLAHGESGKQHSDSAARSALAAWTHSKTALAHSLTAKKATLAPRAQPLEDVSEAVSQPETPEKSRRELVAEAARSPENLARMAAISEHRARTSPLIPGNDPDAQTNLAEFRRRVNRLR